MNRRLSYTLLVLVCDRVTRPAFAVARAHLVAYSPSVGDFF
jgi:hypothetical protein